MKRNTFPVNPERPDSILEHVVPADKLQHLYQECDWEEITAANKEFVAIQGMQVPYANFENENEVTSIGGDALDQRLEETLARLWQLYHTRA